jgi:myo-inositol-1(or 4)-monophosphatase
LVGASAWLDDASARLVGASVRVVVASARSDEECFPFVAGCVVCGAMFVPSAELSTMIDAALAAGDGLLARFRSRSDLAVVLKGPADFVSAADLESERTLRQHLLGAYPTFGLLTEESPPTEAAAGQARFVVDPLDGTTNFLHGIPHFAIAIALEHEGRAVSGLVYDPPKGELFVAERGRGAWLAGGVDRAPVARGALGGPSTFEALRVAEDADFGSALIATGIPHANRVARHEGYLPMLAASMREAAGIRRLAAAALDLSYVAAGRYVAFFEFGLARWDLAAGALLVEEAGGRVSEPSGGAGFLERGEILATNGRLHGSMLSLLRAPTGPSA